MNPVVKYKKLDPRAQVPAYATPGAAAADLCALLDNMALRVKARVERGLFAAPADGLDLL